jgi:acyl-CoA thioester hydrolase
MTDSGNAAASGAVHVTPIQMRWADTDALGHINNVSFVAYVETARIAMFDAMQAPARAFILAHVSVDFRSQIRFGQQLEVRSWVEAIGSASATLRQQIFADSVLAGDGKAVVVHFDYEAQRSKPWPADLRASLERYRQS